MALYLMTIFEDDAMVLKLDIHILRLGNCSNLYNKMIMYKVRVVRAVAKWFMINICSPYLRFSYQLNIKIYGTYIEDLELWPLSPSKKLTARITNIVITYL